MAGTVIPSASASDRPRLQFLDLPTETRRQILEHALLAEAYEYTEHYWKVPTPFDRPIVTIHDLPYTRPPRSAYWGSEKMTRLMRVNKLLHHEVSDIIYSCFAIHVVPWRLQTHISVWAAWAKEHNPLILQKIRHYHLVLPITGFLAGLGPDRDKDVSSVEPDLRDLKRLSDAFPNLTSVRLQVHFTEDHLCNNSAWLRKQTEKILTLVSFWHNLNVTVKVFPDPCNAQLSRGIIAEAQRRLGQKQIHPSVYDRGIRCTHDGSSSTHGCGIFQ